MKVKLPMNTTAPLCLLILVLLPAIVSAISTVKDLHEKVRKEITNWESTSTTSTSTTAKPFSLPVPKGSLGKEVGQIISGTTKYQSAYLYISAFILTLWCLVFFILMVLIFMIFR